MGKVTAKGMLLRGRAASAAPLGGTHGTGSWGARPETRRARNCSPRGLPWGERPRDDPICGQRAAGRGRGRGTEPRVGAGRAAAPPTLAERRTTPCRRGPPAPAPARRAPIRRPAQPHSPVTLRGAGPTCPGAGLRRGEVCGRALRGRGQRQSEGGAPPGGRGYGRGHGASTWVAPAWLSPRQPQPYSRRRSGEQRGWWDGGPVPRLRNPRPKHVTPLSRSSGFN